MCCAVLCCAVEADGADLGLNVSHHESDRVLRVEGVRAEGAVEAWNRQSVDHKADCNLRQGDRPLKDP